MAERSAYPPGLRNVDYGCFDGQRKLDHTTERLQGGFKVPMGTGRNLEHTTERHQRGFKVPMGTGRNLKHTTERHQRGFKVPMETGSVKDVVWYVMIF